jgi:hypothetical protein
MAETYKIFWAKPILNATLYGHRFFAYWLNLLSAQIHFHRHHRIKAFFVNADKCLSHRVEQMRRQNIFHEAYGATLHCIFSIATFNSKC